MCGLVGVNAQHSNSSDSVFEIAHGIAERFAHRDPDNFGVWADLDMGIALSYRRLSILDLSPAGHQPMASASGRFVLAYNGDTYNPLVIRERLTAENRAPVWRRMLSSMALCPSTK